jgi:hypothetical protein
MPRKWIGEKDKEWEVKSHGCWSFPYPLALPISSLSLILKGILATKEESIVKTCRLAEIRILSTIRLVFPIGFQGKKKVMP